MIYCIGLRNRYETALAGPGPVVKRGGKPGDNYPGGWVWETIEGAERFIAANGLFATHSVYGLVADWEADTGQLAGEPYRRLLRDAGIVRIS